MRAAHPGRRRRSRGAGARCQRGARALRGGGRGAELLRAAARRRRVAAAPPTGRAFVLAPRRRRAAARGPFLARRGAGRRPRDRPRGVGAGPGQHRWRLARFRPVLGGGAGSDRRAGLAAGGRPLGGRTEGRPAGRRPGAAPPPPAGGALSVCKVGPLPWRQAGVVPPPLTAARGAAARAGPPRAPHGGAVRRCLRALDRSRGRIPGLAAGRPQDRLGLVRRRPCAGGRHGGGRRRAGAPRPPRRRAAARGRGRPDVGGSGHPRVPLRRPRRGTGDVVGTGPHGGAARLPGPGAQAAGPPVVRAAHGGSLPRGTARDTVFRLASLGVSTHSTSAGAGRTEADVVVVGAGLAGLVATAELADAGRRVVLVDQEPENSLGGQAWWSFGGLSLVDSPEQRRLRVRDSLELARQDWFGTAAFDRAEDHWPRRWAEAYLEFAAGEKRAWLKQQGVGFFPIVGWAERGGYTADGHGNSVPRFHIVWGTGPGVVAPFERRVRAAVEAGLVELRFRHRVAELVVTDGAVTGVRGAVLDPSGVARGEASSRTEVGAFEIAAQAVFVTSGGIGGNHDLVRRNWPARLGPAPQRLLSGVPAHVDGHMLEATEAAGASVVNRDRMW